MKYILSISVLLILGIAFASFSNESEKENNDSLKGIEFFKGNYSEALKQAKKENKYVFLDVYATWCGPCKMLKKKTFKDEDVANYYNKNFINIAIDGETEEGRKLMSIYNINSYPTLLIVDSDGKVKTRHSGFMKPHILVNFGKRIVP
ncbi:MAG: thioredoxin family protein [Flavobacteriaceae bacterium]|nr:thioredoxin family protein [Flavobacteriaceae bacterium]